MRRGDWPRREAIVRRPGGAGGGRSARAWADPRRSRGAGFERAEPAPARRAARAMGTSIHGRRSTAGAVGLVVGTFDDEVRAEQAVRALEVWRRANRGSGVTAVGVVARRASGTV